MEIEKISTKELIEKIIEENKKIAKMEVFLGFFRDGGDEK